ncbi:HI0074 family nucleotidyltransferase substrate-binding subunit [Candidatus Magnetomonas plexicatena]|uniref:HI0074 family nucleotidyltransferase substrate-binding subunit n=1 Tax=Candidatus Magnetomonas plexicatena TaxID=2552947 RepID=UPI001C742960|nr:nucleotidyltransferase [Nitrospirales bacterium LBB_01]
MLLDLSSLRKAVLSLERALNFAGGEKAAMFSETERDVIRAGVIQNFEFTYELSWKFVRRWLGLNVGKANMEGLTRRELFRYARENRLITDIDSWMAYHDARNNTSHSYDSETAQEIFNVAVDFYKKANELLTALEARND